MISLVDKHNELMSTIEACKLLVRIIICNGNVMCNQFCKHYETINRTDYILCPAELKGGTTAVCTEEILNTVKENPERFKKLLSFLTHGRND